MAPELVVEVTSDPAAVSVVRAICDMAHAMGRLATAEGVETVGQLRVLHRLGIDACQGHVIARPMRATELRELLSLGPLPPLDRRW